MSDMDIKNVPFRRTRSSKAIARQSVRVTRMNRSRATIMWRLAKYPEAWLIAGIFLTAWYFGAGALLQL